MSKDLNRCEFIGRLGKDIELRYAPSGDAIANFSIAVGEKWKDKDGEQHERATWVPIVAFGKLADIMDKYLRKGSRVYVAGKLRVRKWQDKEGNDRYSTEIVASELQMLDSKPVEGNGKESASVDDDSNIVSPDFDDDIPF